MSDDPAPRLVALDVDGTILHEDDTLDPRVHRAVVRAAATPGVHVVIATGRSVHSLVQVAARLGLTRGWAVASNGAVTARLDPELPGGHDLTDVVTFDAGPVLKSLRQAMPEALFAVEDAGQGFRLSAHFPPGELTEPWHVVPFDDLCSRPVARVVMRAPERTSADFLTLTERLGYHGVSFAVGWTAWLDIAPAGVNKATALERLRGRLGVDPARTLAAGDGRNDLEMLRWAAHGVAMGQAPAEVRAAADEVCGTVHDGGLAAVLERVADTR